MVITEKYQLIHAKAVILLVVNALDQMLINAKNASHLIIFMKQHQRVLKIVQLDSIHQLVLQENALLAQDVSRVMQEMLVVSVLMELIFWEHLVLLRMLVELIDTLIQIQTFAKIVNQLA